MRATLSWTDGPVTAGRPWDGVDDTFLATSQTWLFSSRGQGA
jgi:hypothetical protein